MSEDQEKIIEIVYKKNKPQYNLLKAAEECSELATVLLQSALKPQKVNAQEVIDEIGDVKIRIKILEHIFGKDNVKKRISYKLSKYKEYNDSSKFENI